jgi:hypothetical protein
MRTETEEEEETLEQAGINKIYDQLEVQSIRRNPFSIVPDTAGRRRKGVLCM